MSKYHVTTGHYEGQNNYPYSSYPGSYGKDVEAEEFKTDQKGALSFWANGVVVAHFAPGSWLSFDLIPEPKPSPVLTEEVFLKHMDNRTQNTAAMTPSISVEERVKAMVKPRALARKK